MSTDQTPYVPTTDIVRQRASHDAARFGLLQELDFERQFDDWLAAHDAEVRASANAVSTTQLRSLADSYACDRWPYQAVQDEYADLMELCEQQVREWLEVAGIPVRDEVQQ